MAKGPYNKTEDSGTSENSEGNIVTSPLSSEKKEGNQQRSNDAAVRYANGRVNKIHEKLDQIMKDFTRFDCPFTNEQKQGVFDVLRERLNVVEKASLEGKPSSIGGFDISSIGQ